MTQRVSLYNDLNHTDLYLVSVVHYRSLLWILVESSSSWLALPGNMWRMRLDACGQQLIAWSDTFRFCGSRDTKYVYKGLFSLMLSVSRVLQPIQLSVTENQSPGLRFMWRASAGRQYWYLEGVWTCGQCLMAANACFKVEEYSWVIASFSGLLQCI